jgi:hypothetical protein
MGAANAYNAVQHEQAVSSEQNDSTASEKDRKCPEAIVTAKLQNDKQD